MWSSARRRAVERTSQEGTGSVAERLAGVRVGVTGVTGFVGQALLSRLLDAVPDAHLVLFCRERPGTSAQERIAALLRDASAFGPLRDRGGVDAALERVEVVAADLDATTGLTIPPLDVLLHVAGSVSFDLPIDEAFRTHVTGLDAFYAAVAAAGCRHLVHVSTAYVAARQPGPVFEEPVRGDVDWRGEASAAERLAERAELASREPVRLARFLAEARRRVGPHGDRATGDLAERDRQRWVREQLVDAGRQRARSLGFADAYTFTKALGERVAEERFGGHHLSVVRPTIVESAVRAPYPGWIEGFKVADPIIIGLGRGDIPDFPGFPDHTVDLVPVDHVANALVVAAAAPPPAGRPAYVTVGTGARNPLGLHRLYRIVRDHFDRFPLPGPAGRGLQLPTWRFPGVDTIERQLRLATSASERAARLARGLPVTSRRLRELGRTLDRHERRFRQLSRFNTIYGIYGQTEAVFLDDTAEALRQRLDGADRVAFGFDPCDLDWDHYLDEVHVPAVSALFRVTPPARTPRELPALTTGDDTAPVLAVFDLDGTVASSNVLTAYLRARWADDPRAFGRDAAEVLVGLPRYLSLDRTGRDRFLRAFYRRFEGADVDELDRLVASELTGQVLGELSPAAVRRIREHRALGHTTILLTGALRSFCEPLRPLFDTIAASELEVDPSGRATGHLAAPPLVGAARAAWLRRYAHDAGADLAASYAYADSRSDVPMLREVGHPVAVDPDLALHRLARRERWPVARWQEDREPVGAR